MENTIVFNSDKVSDEEAIKVLKEVAMALEEKGYSSIDQIVGYLMSGDPGYISNYKNARKKVTEIERVKLLEILVRKYLKSCDILD